MFLRCSVFSTNTESLQQPRDTSLPQARAVHPISAQDNSLGTMQLRVATQDSCAGLQDLARPLFHITVIKKHPTFPLRNSLALPSADTPELVTGNVHLSMSCAVDFIPCQSSLREMLFIFRHRGAHQLGLGLRSSGSSSGRNQSTPCISTLLRERASFLQPGQGIPETQG